MLKTILINIIIFYLAFLFFGYFFADLVIFVPPSPGYHDSDAIIKLKTLDNNTVAAVYLYNKKAKYTILVSHGNAEDLGYMLPYLQQLEADGYSVFAYDYEGYGISTGKPNEKHTYDDVDTAYKYLTQELHIPSSRIISYGRSIGAAVALDLAVRQPVAGIIMESPFLSAFRVLTRVKLLPFDEFDNFKKIKKLRDPLLIIHGTRDKIVPFWQGQKLYEAADTAKQFFAVEGAGHNDVLLYGKDDYWKEIKKFADGLR